MLKIDLFFPEGDSFSESQLARRIALEIAPGRWVAPSHQRLRNTIETRIPYMRSTPSKGVPVRLFGTVLTNADGASLPFNKLSDRPRGEGDRIRRIGRRG